MIPIALTIAGSDSSGGAGVQADLKTFSALGVYGASVITALTAQNTRGVQAVFGVEPDFVEQQIKSVFDDLTVGAVKIGMLGTAETIEAVARGLGSAKPRWVVLDPVMVAKSGDRLLADEAVAALIRHALPLASIITPNLPEAAVLIDRPVPTSRGKMPPVAAQLQDLGPANVLLKGGHLETDESPDLLMHGGELIWLEGERTQTKNTHGTGCTLSSAIAAYLARGETLPGAVARAKAYVDGAIRAADTLEVGGGHGPVHHFHGLWQEVS
ncbi:MAG: bifunctional hydroxymethylpyrimidine kinase/phosphomethylpyrimidine kinase [Geminicoccaceae bacterium]